MFLTLFFGSSCIKWKRNTRVNALMETTVNYAVNFLLHCVLLIARVVIWIEVALKGDVILVCGVKNKLITDYQSID